MALFIDKFQHFNVCNIKTNLLKRSTNELIFGEITAHDRCQFKNINSTRNWEQNVSIIAEREGSSK